MSIIIFGDLFTFPEGSAATNRVYTYARGFIENGINVHVICFENSYLDLKAGIVDRMYYYHPFPPRKRSKYFMVRSWQKGLKCINTILLVRKINKADKTIAINGWSDLLFTHLLGYLLSRIANTKYIIECSEHPLKDYQSNALKRGLGSLIFHLEAFFSDGAFCISHFLINFYKANGVDSRKLFLVPSTVDPNRFSILRNKPVDYKYIGYFGSLTFARDNIDMLIKAYADFSRNHGDIHLILGGFCSDTEKMNIINLIATLNIKEKVLLLDFLTREEILQYVIHADILVMVRANELQGQASYPSKLTEFLATSKPVIAVNAGEISLYLKDGEEAFLVQPGDINGLVEKLDFVYSNPIIATKVGQRGKNLTETIFNYKYQAERMVGFIKSLYNDG